MSTLPNNQEEEFRQAVQAELGNQPLPPKAQIKLEEAYASLQSIPQEKSKSCSSLPAQPSLRSEPQITAIHGNVVKIGRRLVRRSVVIAAAAAFVVLLGGTAFAASSLLQMKEGEVSFFGNGSNLPVYNSLEAGVSSLNAEVGDSADMSGITVTLDTVSTDRNIVNLFFTLEKEGGFDLSAASMYEGSNENEWVRLQNVVPRFAQAQITSKGELLCSNAVNLLDAYSEEGKIKCLMRIVPSVVLPDEVNLALFALEGEGEQGEQRVIFDVGVDLGEVIQPAELGARDVVFQTSEGEKTLGIKRFTRSELGTVFVVRNDEIETFEENGRPIYQPSDTSLLPQMLKISDDQNNTLQFVGAGDGAGLDPSADYVIELAGMSNEAKGVTFTPMLYSELAFDQQGSDEVRKEYNELHKAQQIDVSQIGSQLATSEYGGYELTGWDVAHGAVTLSLKPYGWVNDGLSGGIELIPNEEVPSLRGEYTDSTTGEAFMAAHSGIMYRKFDYQTGEMLHMVSYYAATDEELREVNLYTYRPSFGVYVEEASAAQALTFS